MNNIDNDLNSLSREGLVKEIIRLRAAIRYAKQQQKDDLCYLDFFRLFELLPEYNVSRDFGRSMLNPKDMRKNCDIFIDCMACYVNNPNKSIDEIYEIWKTNKPY